MLRKPVPLADLLACAQQAQKAPQAQAGNTTLAPAKPYCHAPPTDLEQAVHHFFGGDAQGHAGFAQRCKTQFGLDRVAGNQALAAADWPALGRLAHSLRSVLSTLGQTSDSDLAACLESAAQRAQAAECQRLWLQLSSALLTPLDADRLRVADGEWAPREG